MREIKFRGKRKDNGEWVYGYYCEIQGRHIIIPSFKNSNSEIRPFIGTQNGINGYHQVDSATVGQFTGLHDKNGKEIYGTVGEKGGDIIKTKGKGIFIVVFDNGAFRLQDISTELWFCVLNSYNVNELGIEVIGNMAENPELQAEKP